MRFALALGIAAVAIVYFSHRASTALNHDRANSATNFGNVSVLLERASSGKPLDGRPSPGGRWIRHMTAACAERERLLAGVGRPTSAASIASRGARILAIHRAYAARVDAIRPPSAYSAEGRQIQTLDARERRALARVVAAARTGDLGLATREAVELRELAGESNALFLRLGLRRCAFGTSSMPL